MFRDVASLVKLCKENQTDALTTEGVNAARDALLEESSVLRLAS